MSHSSTLIVLDFSYCQTINYFEVSSKEPPSYLPDEEKEFRRECGGATKPGQLTGEIVSPGYPVTFPRNATCYWLIRVEPRQRVYIRLAHLHLSATIGESWHVFRN
ncbi:hypothetical protein OSTOST_12095 [Ostertagia ostertagi]